MVGGLLAFADWKLRLLSLLQVEHIIREENMMAAQEILELFCELIAVRLPIIEAQKFVPPYLTSILPPVIPVAVRLFMFLRVLQPKLACNRN